VKSGENALEIEVRNTAANELSGNPARLKEVESNGWLVNSYFRIYSKFDVEMVPQVSRAGAASLEVKPVAQFRIVEELG